MTSEEARSWLFDNFVNFSPPFNILSRRLKAVHTLCHYLQQPVAYCNGSLQSREDVFEFIIAAESASNLPLERSEEGGWWWGGGERAWSRSVRSPALMEGASH